MPVSWNSKYHPSPPLLLTSHVIILYSVSHTTRQQRSKESHGRDYFFIDNNTFSKAMKKVCSMCAILMPCLMNPPLFSILECCMYRKFCFGKCGVLHCSLWAVQTINFQYMQHRMFKRTTAHYKMGHIPFKCPNFHPPPPGKMG